MKSTVKEMAEYREALEKLRKSEEKFHDFANILPLIIYEINSEGRITFTNSEGFSRFGYNQQELEQGLNLIDMVAPQDRERAMQNIMKVLSGEPQLNQEYNAIGKGGIPFTVIANTTPMIEDYKIVGARGVAFDISSRKAAEESLKLSEEKFAKAFYSSPSPMMLSTLKEGRNIEVNLRRG